MKHKSLTVEITDSAHTHIEMIMAKAANMELVVFTKNETEDWCKISSREFMPMYSGDEFFLCLPQHKEACLHWLNGGEVQNNITKHLQDDSWNNFIPFESPQCELWSCECNFMREESNFRIKPRKESRWIACNIKNGNVYGMFPSKTECIAAWPALQPIEIEVEV